MKNNQTVLKWKETLRSFSLIIGLHKIYLVYLIIGILLSTIQPFILIIFPRYIINELTGAQNMTHVIYYVAAMGILLLLVNGLNAFIQQKQEQHASILMNKIGLYVGDVSMRMELSALEQSANSDKIEMAKQSQNSVEAIRSFVNIISQLFTVVGLVVIICSYNVFVFIATLFVLAVKLFSQYKVNQSWGKCRAQAMPYERKGAYLNSYVIDHSGAKEIRLHNLRDWMYAKMVHMVDVANSAFMKNFRITAVYNILAEFVFDLQVLFYYIVLTLSVIRGQISIGDFVMYITTIPTLSGSLDSIAASVTAIQRSLVYLRDFQLLNQFVKEGDELPAIPQKELCPEHYDIEFQNVTFRYPGTDHDVLKNVSITIPEGQRLAVVGPNGAGKTTFIKLLCGFYRPTSGKILMGGIDIWEMPHDVLLKHIGAVFQDFQIFAFSFADNIVMDEAVQPERINKVLNQVQLSEKLKELPNGLETYLYKDFDESGVEFSGGQMQKLAIARALYKSPSILILDEPTANLDALIEYEIYQNLKDISKDKTSIFISHRMASTRFSDVIAVFSDGEISEYGTHEKLMERKGLYAEMFEKQARYYTA